MSDSLSSLFSPATVERFVWVLVHSLWQFALLALIAFLAARILQQRSAAARYAILLIGMHMMAAMPVAT
jgi:bla regulator protein blaR1